MGIGANSAIREINIDDNALSGSKGSFVLLESTAELLSELDASDTFSLSMDNTTTNLGIGGTATINGYVFSLGINDDELRLTWASPAQGIPTASMDWKADDSLTKAMLA
ncbi:hypothetical protein SDC9_177770 [bioreactor metagenome]|uniref:Uncharacterized protein n=1 Tax=bioreactor metagenome TaxID=1076179 RepID=A0A645GVM3_9ZZZZ